MTRSRARTLRTLGSLLSLAAQPCQAAWLAGTAAASRRASSQAAVAGRSALTAATPPTSAFATCDRRLGTCRLSGGTAAAPPAGDFEWRRGAPARMQEVACPTDVEDDPEDMSTQYSPTEVEQRLYNWWEKSGYFKPTGHQEDEKQCFIIPMPPPNVTGRLHMGHAMFVTLEEIMASVTLSLSLSLSLRLSRALTLTLTLILTRTSWRASNGCAASRRSGCPAPTTRALRPR